MPRLCRLLLLGLLLPVAACPAPMVQLWEETVRNQPLDQEEMQGPHTRILAVPSYRSSGSCCGLAALWMVLDYWQERFSGRDLSRAECPAGGYSAGQLAQMAKDQGFKTFLYSGRPSDLARHLAATRPVIVLLRRWGRNHFVVVSGQASDGRLVVNDPSRGVVYLGRGDLMEQWKDSNRLSLLIVPSQ